MHTEQSRTSNKRVIGQQTALRAAAERHKESLPIRIVKLKFASPGAGGF